MFKASSLAQKSSAQKIAQQYEQLSRRVKARYGWRAWASFLTVQPAAVTGTLLWGVLSMLATVVIPLLFTRFSDSLKTGGGGELWCSRITVFSSVHSRCYRLAEKLGRAGSASGRAFSGLPLLF